MTLLFYLISFLAFFLTFILTKYFIKNYQKLNLVDIPNERSSHTVKTPRAGGIAIFLSLFVCLFIQYVLVTPQSSDLLLIIGAFLISCIGFYDDKKGMRAEFKFFLQFLVIAPLTFFALNDSSILKIVLVIAFTLFVMNTFNFMDGIDAIASFQALPIFCVYFILSKNPIFLFLVASLIAFSIFNFPPAKIFLGDAGSLPIGYLIGIAPFFYATNHSFTLVASFIILCNITFLFDASLTLLLRTIRKKNVLKAHREHIYQKAFDSGTPAKKISLYNLCLTGTASIISAYLFSINHASLLKVFFVFSAIFAALYLLLLIPYLRAKRTLNKA